MAWLTGCAIGMARPSSMPDLGDVLSGSARVRFDASRLDCESDPLAWFDPSSPQLQAQSVTVGGRQAAWFVNIQGYPAVLRHYRRGGLVATLSSDRYLWTGWDSSRPFAEFSLMRELGDLGLPVPAPLAAAVWRDGLTYRAAILVDRVPDARTLATCEEIHAWEAAGQAIATMHAKGVWHADLNVHNILIDAQSQAWLIDFDRGRRFKALSEHKRQGNLDRLHRSIRKVLPGKEPILWPVLCNAYFQARQVNGASTACAKKIYHQR